MHLHFKDKFLKVFIYSTINVIVDKMCCPVIYYLKVKVKGKGVPVL
jgi:hypothetical protein